MHGHPEEAVGRGCDAAHTPSQSQPGGDASATAQHEATCGQPGSASCVYACARARARASAALARVPVRGPTPKNVTFHGQHAITQITVAATRTHTSSTMRRARKG